MPIHIPAPRPKDAKASSSDKEDKSSVQIEKPEMRCKVTSGGRATADAVVRPILAARHAEKLKKKVQKDPTFDPETQPAEAYRPESGRLSMAYRFPETISQGETVGCRYREFLRGMRPRPGKTKRKNHSYLMPRAYDLKDFDRFSFGGQGRS